MHSVAMKSGQAVTNYIIKHYKLCPEGTPNSHPLFVYRIQYKLLSAVSKVCVVYNLQFVKSHQRTKLDTTPFPSI